MTKPDTRTKLDRTHRHALIVLAGCAIACLSGCYERVVNVRQGTYRGNVYDSNLPSGTNGVWQDPAYGQPGSDEQPTAAELNQNASKAYQRQLKDLGTNSGRSGD